MSEAVIITTIICVTVIAVCFIGSDKSSKKKGNDRKEDK